jgi:D-alanyl-D-alanine carboxypeptidase
MIDLKKQTKHSSFKNKKPKKPQNKDAKAKKFLCIILSLVVVFIGVTCIAVAKKNHDIVNTTQNGTVNNTNNTNNTVNLNASNAPDNTPESSTPDTTIQSVDLNILPPGTVDNPTIITLNEVNPYLTLINAYYRISDEYKPDLVYVCSSDIQLDKVVAQKYEEMYNAALKEGVTLTPVSGYHSYEAQETKYNKKIDFFKSQGYTEAEAKAKASSFILPPGSSEHNLGFAIDIVYAEEWFETTKEFSWLQENAANYGFILRYPKDKQDATDVIYEPWHWRYVGVEAAQQIKINNTTLEEYLGVSQ